MKRNRESPATRIYRAVARLTARSLASTGLVESVLLRRSAATGEVRFGRSDIDLSVVVSKEVAADERRIEALYRKVRFLKRLNPRLDHMEVHERGDIENIAGMDTYWGSQERRTLILLHGSPVEIPRLPVRPDHAVAKFALWVGWFFSESVQRGSRRNIWKIALEDWNAFAIAEGLLEEPFLIRTEMEAHLGAARPDVMTARLHESQYATTFVLDLAERLHQRRLPELRKLAKPYVFEAVVPPLSQCQKFLVLPRAECPLPASPLDPGTFICTPETLHLYVHYTNAFLYWALPPEILDLGIAAPSVAGFLRSCRYYGHNRFLRHPGFAKSSTYVPIARVKYLRHALQWLADGEIPPAIPQPETRRLIAEPPTCAEYYHTVYGGLRSESEDLHQLAVSLSDNAGPKQDDTGSERRV
jgi:predicted nucleotidyltransferase